VTTYLVTGANGLLGSHLTEMLVGRGERPRALIRPGESPEPLDESRVDLRRGDMGDASSLRAAVSGVDVVLHCAARTGPWGDPAEYERTNVSGLRVLVDAALGAGVSRFVHVSSITVHGNDVGGSADENSQIRTEPNPYSRTKVAAERVLAGMIERDGAPISIVRPGWIYGPGDRASFGRFASMVEQRRMIVMGRGDNHVPLVYVDDVARGILLAAGSPRAAGRTYLLVNDEPVTQNEYLGAIARELGAPSPNRRLPYRLALLLGAAAETAWGVMGRPQAPPVTRFGIQLLGGENLFSIARARQELGFAPEVKLAEGVRRGVEWYAATRAAARTVTQTA
jgi:nucleoside-diphosphate-sugar epimerase